MGSVELAVVGPIPRRTHFGFIALTTIAWGGLWSRQSPQVAWNPTPHRAPGGGKGVTTSLVRDTLEILLGALLSQSRNDAKVSIPLSRD